MAFDEGTRQWHEMWDLFHRALENERPLEWLNGQCDDPELRRRVEELLAAADDSETALLPADPAPPALDQCSRSFQPGDRLGAYSLKKVLGEGGMGRVFLADQAEPIERTVALKVIKRGMDSDEVVSRFAEERQILARLNHPNIATVLDAGLTADGRPYFVMEAVDGEPIDTFCDQRRLDLRQRASLMRDVCAAIQHAHQKGVVHRDLKPSNILVTEVDGRPLPKVIDFGIAKALHQAPDQRRTRHGQILGTPAFMSPEQIGLGDLDIDSRTDVYALGVLLYLLFSGRLPPAISWLGSSPSSSAETPSMGGVPDRVAPAMVKAFDALTMAQAQDIAEARACPPSRLRQDLVGDLEWIVSRAMSEDRELRYASCSELAADLERHLRDEAVLAGPPSLTYRARKVLARYRLLVVTSAIFLLALIMLTVGLAVLSTGLNRALKEANAESVRREKVIGFLVDIFRDADPNVVGARDRSAREVLDHGAERILDQLDDPAIYVPLAQAIARVYGNLGEYHRQANLLTAAVQRRRMEGDIDPLELAQGLHDLGAAQAQVGDWNLAASHLAAALDHRREILGSDHEATLRTSLELGKLRFRQSRQGEALEILEGILPELEGRLDLRLLYARTLRTLGHVHLRIENFQTSKDLFLRSLELFRDELPEGDRQVINTLNGLALTYEKLDQYDQTRAIYDRVIQERARRLGSDHPDVASFKSNLALSVLRQGNAEEAAQISGEAVESFIKTLGPEHFLTLTARRNHSTMVAHAGDSARAMTILQEVCPRMEAVVGADHTDFLICQALLAHRLHAQEQWRPAEAIWRRLVSFYKEAGPEVTRWRTTQLWGYSLLKLGRVAEAEPLLVDALEFRMERFGTSHRKTLETWTYLQELLEQEGRQEDLAQWRRRLSKATDTEG